MESKRDWHTRKVRHGDINRGLKKERKREEDGWKKKVKGNEKERRTEREKELVCVRHT